MRFNECLDSLRGNGLIVFSDAGGANACMALAEILGSEKKQKIYIYSNQKNYLLNNWTNLVNETDEIPDLKNIKPDFLFTGTSHSVSSDSFELKIIVEAKKNKIPVISFVDHWVNFKKRFLLNDQLILPDQIWVPDEKAMELAIEEGIDKNYICICENPYHYYLTYIWKSVYSGKDYLKSLNIDVANKTVIIYAPDPLSLIYEKEKMGFDEYSVADEIIQVLSLLNPQKFILIIKKHPRHQNDFPQKAINDNLRIVQLNSINNPELINAADCVIGFYSNFLIDATCLNKPVIRYFPKKTEADLLKNHNIGHLVSGKELLFVNLQSILNLV